MAEHAKPAPDARFTASAPAPAPPRPQPRPRTYARFLWIGGLLLACVLCAFGPMAFRYVMARMQPAILGKWQSLEQVVVGTELIEFKADGTGEFKRQAFAEGDKLHDFQWQIQGDSLVIETTDSAWHKEPSTARFGLAKKVHRDLGLDPPKEADYAQRGQKEICTWKIEDDVLTIQLVDPPGHSPMVLRKVR
jgi:hypothetical protein